MMIEPNGPAPVVPPGVPPPVKVSAWWRLLAPLIAITGGLAGLVGSFIEESQQGGIAGLFLGPFLAAPVIEEALKPSGVYLILAKWPKVLTNRWYTGFLAALGGLCFGIIENLIYLNIYFPNHSQKLVIIRFTAGLVLHTFNSFIVGLGLDSRLIAGVRGDIPLFSANKRYFIIPMVIHAAYNIAATVFGRYLK